MAAGEWHRLRPVRALLLEPIGSGGEAENAEERTRGLFVACGDGAPFFQPCPEVLDEMAVVVDPLRAGNGRVGTPGRDGRPCAQVPDALAKGIGGEAAVPDNPPGHATRACPADSRADPGQAAVHAPARGLPGSERDGDRAP